MHSPRPPLPSPYLSLGLDCALADAAGASAVGCALPAVWCSGRGTAIPNPPFPLLVHNAAHSLTWDGAVPDRGAFGANPCGIPAVVVLPWQHVSNRHHVSVEVVAWQRA